MKKLIFRIYQKIMYLMSFFISFKEPVVVNDLKDIIKILENSHQSKVMIVSDQYLSGTAKFKAFTDLLKAESIHYSLYNDTLPNPSIPMIEEALSIYKENQCQGIIAYGGGSVIDLAKALGARVVRPNKSIENMRGTLKILKKLPLLIAIPSTVGTGSEATLAAVVSNPRTKEKCALMDPVLMPKYAILDLSVVESLPPKLIAETGMDALTHAIEAYLGKANTRKTKKMALSAIKIIFNHLEKAYSGNIDSLGKMQVAAYQAGVAFTRAYVGNVHAIAHQLSAYYHLGHGYANAVILPYVLRYYHHSIDRKMAKIYDDVFGDSDLSLQDKSISVIEAIESLKDKLMIDSSFKGLIKEGDVLGIVEKAYKEANPLYPVPKIFDHQDFLNVIQMINQ
ncbi:iron-containing alcohol dehydrogenase [Hujiaoplasma nucleasis]|nr:iron-containing alcohol dehydrogenase [Hujiaoplasma nucleasis]